MASLLQTYRPRWGLVMLPLESNSPRFGQLTALVLVLVLVVASLVTKEDCGTAISPDRVGTLAGLLVHLHNAPWTTLAAVLRAQGGQPYLTQSSQNVLGIKIRTFKVVRVHLGTKPPVVFPSQHGDMLSVKVAGTSRSNVSSSSTRSSRHAHKPMAGTEYCTDHLSNGFHFCPNYRETAGLGVNEAQFVV